jgi:hypothetical protein
MYGFYIARYTLLYYKDSRFDKGRIKPVTQRPSGAVPEVLL